MGFSLGKTLGSTEQSARQGMKRNLSTTELARLDKAHVWHPFTQMADWCHDNHHPLIIKKSKGIYLFDAEGRSYIDGNSSIWTNVHGHGHPRILEAVQEQSQRLAHASLLGFSNEPSILLAAELAEQFSQGALPRSFFSDDGSTALECAVKMAIQYWQQTGQGERDLFVSFDQAYHGDTLGASALGGIKAFHDRFRRYGMEVVQVADLEALDQLPDEVVRRLAGVCIEPLIQGAAGMRTWPSGMLSELRHWCHRQDTFLILDEVMTGMGRTGSLFACQKEGVVPDFLCLAKGLSGGLLPLAVTMTTERVFEGFLGSYESMRTFFHGHSYSGNPLGCAAARACLAIFREEKVLEKVGPKIEDLERALAKLKVKNPHVGAIRQCGMMAGIDVVDLKRKHPFQLGAKVCLKARDYRVLTRPIRDTIVVMPPLCIEPDEIEAMIDGIDKAICMVLDS